MMNIYLIGLISFTTCDVNILEPFPVATAVCSRSMHRKILSQCSEFVHLLHTRNKCFVCLCRQDLGRLGRDLSQVVIVDNSPASYVLHPENAVSIASDLSCCLLLLLWLFVFI